MIIKAYGVPGAEKPLGPIDIERRRIERRDVEIVIDYCGVCHSDLHQVRSEWGRTLYPCVPGHEIVGHVTTVGSEVTRFKVGDTVGVGCMIASCQRCPACAEGLEQYCENGFTATYNAPSTDWPGHTLGGYSQRIVIDDRFVLKITHSAKHLPGVAPLLCAGITTYSSLRRWRVGPGMKVGIVGIGGLGHIGVKLSHAMGAYTVAFTTSRTKCEDVKALGADAVVLSHNAREMEAQTDSLDFILNTAASSHDLDAYINLLKRDGTMTLVGLPKNPHLVPDGVALILKRRSLAGSMIGGVAETQEMLDFCAKKGIVAEVEIIPAQKIDISYDRMHKNDVKYRFVIDNGTLADCHD